MHPRFPGLGFQNFEILTRGESGRVGKIRIFGDSKTMDVDGLAVRWTLDVPDTLFTAKRLSLVGVVVGERGRFGMAVRNVCCQTCSTVYVSPRPTAVAMAEYYRSAYRKHYGGVGYPDANGKGLTPGAPGSFTPSPRSAARDRGTARAA